MPQHFGYRCVNCLANLSKTYSDLNRSDVEEGGETIFPDANVNSSSLPWYNELSECARKGLAVKPKMGDALLFWSMKPDATLDPLSLHG